MSRRIRPGSFCSIRSMAGTISFFSNSRASWMSRLCSSVCSSGIQTPSTGWSPRRKPPLIVLLVWAGAVAIAACPPLSIAAFINRVFIAGLIAFASDMGLAPGLGQKRTQYLSLSFLPRQLKNQFPHGNVENADSEWTEHDDTARVFAGSGCPIQNVRQVAANELPVSGLLRG